MTDDHVAGAERAPELIAWAVQWLRLEADDRESGMRFENKDARATITKLHAAADAIADLSRAPAKFDAMVPAQEELAIKFCHEIAGPRGKKGSPPDPVRLLEMAEALYRAEIGSVASRTPALAGECERLRRIIDDLRRTADGYLNSDVSRRELEVAIAAALSSKDMNMWQAYCWAEKKKPVIYVCPEKDCAVQKPCEPCICGMDRVFAGEKPIQRRDSAAKTEDER